MASMRLFKKNTVPRPTPLQIAVKEFDGRNYLKLNDEEVEIVDTMKDLWYVRIDMDGHISVTERGQGILDGTVKTNYDVPRFLRKFMSEEESRCGTAGFQS